MEAPKGAPRNEKMTVPGGPKSEASKKQENNIHNGPRIHALAWNDLTTSNAEEISLRKHFRHATELRPLQDLSTSWDSPKGQQFFDPLELHRTSYPRLGTNTVIAASMVFFYHAARQARTDNEP
jgi:hypothetical protein